MIFVHKPTTFIRHDDITHVELLWVSEYVGSTGRSFDIKIITSKQEEIQFTSIDKSELKIVKDYFETWKIKVRFVNE